ncbi:hypothetical protein KK083_09200 [Fulvivirgaceae bacterium PWU4]|uniref:Uncharacterized protein n=1 Tax=Chryseosolibacter histidini TaxID=2782349 RepID=A0AAP2DN14_9BACT|nr:hypothetical protein [Chryseosolibacter histidini]MBT1697049.1 hypothetical protein [Chryseosolibacter histidini]
MSKPRVMILIVFALIVVSVIIYFVSTTYKARIARQMFDTVAYTEEDYELMRAYFNSDTALQRVLNENIRAGDSASVHMKKFLSTSYQFRDTTRLQEWEIKGMIHSYRVSIDVLRKFAAIDSKLKELEGSIAPKNADDSAAQQQLDSLRKLVNEGKLAKEYKSPLDPQ